MSEEKRRKLEAAEAMGKQRWALSSGPVALLLRHSSGLAEGRSPHMPRVAEAMGTTTAHEQRRSDAAAAMGSTRWRLRSALAPARAAMVEEKQRKLEVVEPMGNQRWALSSWPVARLLRPAVVEEKRRRVEVAEAMGITGGH